VGFEYSALRYTVKILFLDDRKARHDAFLKANIGRSIDQAWDYEGAAKLLEANSPYDVVHLDHDLSWRQQNYFCMGAPEPPDEKNGTDVANFIASLPADKHPKMAVIHSFNPPGAQRMAAILRQVGITCVVHPFEY